MTNTTAKQLDEARATIARLNKRCQVAEAAVNALSNDGMRHGLRSERILSEYWQRAEDARNALRKIRVLCDEADKGEMMLYADDVRAVAEVALP